MPEDKFLNMKDLRGAIASRMASGVGPSYATIRKAMRAGLPHSTPVSGRPIFPEAQALAWWFDSAARVKK